jgi:hypothetical protein
MAVQGAEATRQGGPGVEGKVAKQASSRSSPWSWVAAGHHGGDRSGLGVTKPNAVGAAELRSVGAHLTTPEPITAKSCTTWW